jgi:hypothetical protein
MLFARHLPPFWRKIGAQALRQYKSFSLQHISGRGQQMKTVRILGQTAITGFTIAEHLLDVPERMFCF